MTDSVDDFFAELERYSTQSLEQRVDSFTMSRQSSTSVMSTSQTVVAPPATLDKETRKKKKRVRDEEAGASIGSGQEVRWVCSRCTLENESTVSNCDACGQGRDASCDSSWICAKCGVVNTSQDTRKCVQCRSSKRVAPPPVATASQTAMAGTTTSPTAGSPMAVNEGEAPQPTLLVDAEDDNDDEGPENEDEEEYDDDEYQEESEDDESEDEEEEQPAASRVSDPVLAQQIVDFLTNLPALSHEHLPLAARPTSMMKSAPLRPFQLQGLYWLMQREGHMRGGGVSPTSSSAPLSFIDKTRADLLREADRLLYTKTNANGLGSLGARRPQNSEVLVRELDAPRAQQQADNGSEMYYSGGILGDYMGLGKTKMLIALCESTKVPRADRLLGNRVSSTATIVICPMSLMAQWSHEITTSVYPPPRILRYYGTRRKKSIFEIAQQYDYVLTSYQTLAREPPAGSNPPSKLRMIHWRRAILDEAHYIRNRTSNQSRAAVQILDAKYRWVVTATPLQNRLNDVFPLVEFLRVPHFGEWSWWNANIAVALERNSEDERALTALQVLFSSLMLRRLPTTTIQGVRILDLPPKVIRTVSVKLSTEEQEVYDAVFVNAKSRVDVASRNASASHNQLRTYGTAFEMLMRLRQCCLHPYIVIRALMRKAESQGLDNTVYLPQMPTVEGGATQADMDRFVEGIKRKLKNASTEYAKEALSGVANLKETECTICMDAMSKPSILPCLHTFCQECILHALQVTRGCPLCKRPTKANQVTLVPNVVEQKALSLVTSSNLLSEGSSGSALNNLRAWPLSTKAKTALQMIRSLPEGEKMIVFSHFVTFLEYFATVLDAHGITYKMYTGGMSANARNRVIQAFSSERSQPQVLLATITTCGVGINLTRANHCILVDPSWNPGVEEQAMNRIHRLGQERHVSITRLMCENTVDAHIEKLANAKKCLSEGVVDRRPRVGQRLGRQELLELFAPTAPAPTSE